MSPSITLTPSSANLLTSIIDITNLRLKENGGFIRASNSLPYTFEQGDLGFGPSVVFTITSNLNNSFTGLVDYEKEITFSSAEDLLEQLALLY